MRERIGEVAGYVWDYIESEGESSVSSIVDSIEAPGTKVYMAIGWLAHEGEIEFHEQDRGKTVALS